MSSRSAADRSRAPYRRPPSRLARAVAQASGAPCSSAGCRSPAGAVYCYHRGELARDKQHDADLAAVADRLLHLCVGRFDQVSPCGHVRSEIIGDGTYSINDALVTLATIGLEQVAGIVQANLDKATREQVAYAELMAFFLANPVTEVANATDFPARSPADLIERTDTDYHKGVDGSELGWDRNLAAEHYTGTQHQILQLTVAKGAIQKALTR